MVSSPTSVEAFGVNVIVLGMHRSGTSLASGLLSHAGVYFGEPDDFIAPNQENPKGFWERRDVRALNDRLLHAAGCDWSEVAGFADAIIPPEVLVGFKDEAGEIVANLRADAPYGAIGMKEPRLCLLLPYWLEVLGDQCFYVLVHRDPAEIALSLEKRNRIPPAVAHYLTEVYLGNAIRLASAAPCHIVSYLELVRSPLKFTHTLADALNQLGCALEVRDEEEIRDYASTALHRFRVTGAEVPSDGTLRAWCRTLESGKLPEPSADWPVPPATVLQYEHRKRFDEYRRAAVQRDSLGARVDALQHTEAELEARLAATDDELRDGRLRRLIDQAGREVDRARIYELENTVFQFQQDIGAADKRICEQSRQLASLQQELVTLTLQVGRLEQRRSVLTKTLKEAEDNSRELADITQGLVERLNALDSSLSWKLLKPFLALLLNPFRLGFGGSVITDIRSLTGQHAAWAAAWEKRVQANNGRLENPPAIARSEPAEKPSPPLIPGEIPARTPLRPQELRERLNTAALKVGLAVTESSETSGAGDYYTASELAAALSAEFGWQCVLLGKNDTGRDWYDVDGLDCLIVLLESYDLRKVRAAGKPVLRIAWVRNWTDQWVAKPWFALYDLILCSSERARKYIGERTGNNAAVLRIATNTKRFNPAIEAKPELQSDYCFTGSFWGAPRRIEALDPAALPFDFALYGRGWQGHPQFSRSWRGSVPYADIPGVYRSTKILVDDANHVTAPWGSVNSRVFDSLACGTLVLSNGRKGIEELFGDRLPTWSTVGELQGLLAHFLDHPSEREALAAELREDVVRGHTYRNRAGELREILLGEVAAKAGIAIKLPFESLDEARCHDEFHLARGLAAELRSLGYAVRLDMLPQWPAERPLADDVVLCFQGKAPYSPREGERLLLWLTRYPGGTQPGMYDGYERILVASHCFAEQLAGETGTPVTAFLPCASPERFPFAGEAQRSRQVLFSGNADGEVHPILRDAIEGGLAPMVVGRGWDGLIDPVLIKREHLDDGDLAQVYAACRAVLCGHGQAEREHGFVTRRVFDTLTSGGVPVTENVRGITDILGKLIHVYDGSPGGVKCAIEKARDLDTTSAEHRARVETLVDRYSFQSGAVCLDAIISDLLGLKAEYRGGNA